jgi:phosphohistidine phosphatase
VEPSLYHATPADAIAVLKAISNQTARTVLIVGHNPGLEDLVSRLSGEHHDLVTAAIVELAVPIDRWSEFDATIAATIGETWQPSR